MSSACKTNSSVGKCVNEEAQCMNRKSRNSYRTGSNKGSLVPVNGDTIDVVDNINRLLEVIKSVLKSDQDYNREYINQWHELHPGYQSTYCSVNGERVKETMKRWRQEHAKHVREYTRKLREEHPEYFRKYRKRNNRKLRKYWRENKRKARRKIGGK
jgi:hypothetical protein